MSEQNQVDMQQQLFQQQSMMNAGEASTGENNPGMILGPLLRKFGLNGHTLNGLDQMFSLSSMWGGLQLGAASLFSSANLRGGPLTTLFERLGFTSGGSIHGGEAAGGGGGNPHSGDGGGNYASDGGGGGDVHAATLNSIPTAAIHDTGIADFGGQFMGDAPQPKASSARAPRGESADAGMGIS